MINQSNPQLDKNLARQAREAAFAFLGLAKKPSGRVRQRLLDKGFCAQLADSVISQLAADGYLDDLGLARKTIAQRQGSRAESQRALAWRMQQAGIAADAVEIALQAAPADVELARDLWQCKFETAWQKLASDAAAQSEQRKFLAKAARFMAGRGFSPSLISRLIPFI